MPPAPISLSCVDPGPEIEWGGVSKARASPAWGWGAPEPRRSIDHAAVSVPELGKAWPWAHGRDAWGRLLPQQEEAGRLGEHSGTIPYWPCTLGPPFLTTPTPALWASGGPMD